MVLGKEHASALTSMSNLIEVLSAQGKYQWAGEMHWRESELRKTVLAGSILRV